MGVTIYAITNFTFNCLKLVYWYFVYIRDIQFQFNYAQLISSLHHYKMWKSFREWIPQYVYDDTLLIKWDLNFFTYLYSYVNICRSVQCKRCQGPFTTHQTVNVEHGSYCKNEKRNMANLHTWQTREIGFLKYLDAFWHSNVLNMSVQVSGWSVWRSVTASSQNQT